MYDIPEILTRLKHNEEIAKKFFEVETQILSIFDFRGLFETLLSEIKKKFNIPHVWFSIIEDNDVAYLIKDLKKSNRLKHRLNFIEKNFFLKLVSNKQKPILANKDLKPYYDLFPLDKNYLIRSIAVVPLTLDDQIIGSINFGDPSPERYSQGMNTLFLEQLSVKLSICFTNVAANTKLRSTKSKDPLTGLLNRRVMESILSREVSRSLRYKTVLSLIFFHLGHLKNINEEYGQRAGDVVLMHMSGLLRNMSRENDVIARYGGDDFAFILPSTSRGDAGNLVDRLIKHIRNTPFMYKERHIPIEFSYGIADTNEIKPKDVESLVEAANKRLHAYKTR